MEVPYFKNFRLAGSGSAFRSRRTCHSKTDLPLKNFLLAFCSIPFLVNGKDGLRLFHHLRQSNEKPPLPVHAFIKLNHRMASKQKSNRFQQRRILQIYHLESIVAFSISWHYPFQKVGTWHTNGLKVLGFAKSWLEEGPPARYSLFFNVLFL
jgi:hypothetical protein